jgi:hypothetical protein
MGSHLLLRLRQFDLLTTLGALPVPLERVPLTLPEPGPKASATEVRLDAVTQRPPRSGAKPSNDRELAHSHTIIPVMS